jgi:hypothetical protein
VRTNLTCEACERELSAYLDGALHPAVAGALESHLNACHRCGLKLGAYRAIAERLAELPEISAPAWLESRVIGAVSARPKLKRLWSGGLAAAAALSFAGTIGLIAWLPRLARSLSLPDPTLWPVAALQGSLNGIIALAKRLAIDLTFYEPIARQIWGSIRALEALPRAAFLILRTPEGGGAVAIALTLGVALFFALRPSRTHQGGIGHACLSL